MTSSPGPMRFASSASRHIDVPEFAVTPYRREHHVASSASKRSVSSPPYVLPVSRISSAFPLCSGVGAMSRLGISMRAPPLSFESGLRLGFDEQTGESCDPRREESPEYAPKTLLRGLCSGQPERYRVASRGTEAQLLELAAWGAGLRAVDIPPAIVERSKLVLLDLIGCNLAGSRDDGMAELARALGRRAGRATLAGTPVHADAAAAALFNASAIVALELDETNLFAKGHPGAHVWPAVLAAAEESGHSGQALFTAFITGYEIGARVAHAARLSPAVHPHGTAVALAASAGLAKLWHYTPVQLAAAVQQGAALVVPADWNAARLGATVRNLFAGVSVQNAFVAAESIRCGFTHNPATLDQVFGRILGTGFEASALTSNLGTQWAIAGAVYFKHHACCLSVHSALDALIDLKRRAGFEAADVRSVAVETYRSAAQLNDREPATPLGAKFSIPHALAAAMVLGETGVEAFGAASLRNESVRSLAHRITVSEDPLLTA